MCFRLPPCQRRCQTPLPASHLFQLPTRRRSSVQHPIDVTLWWRHPTALRIVQCVFKLGHVLALSFVALHAWLHHNALFSCSLHGETSGIALAVPSCPFLACIVPCSLSLCVFGIIWFVQLIPVNMVAMLRFSVLLGLCCLVPVDVMSHRILGIVASVKIALDNLQLIYVPSCWIVALNSLYFDIGLWMLVLYVKGMLMLLVSIFMQLMFSSQHLLHCPLRHLRQHHRLWHGLPWHQRAHHVP